MTLRATAAALATFAALGLSACGAAGADADAVAASAPTTTTVNTTTVDVAATAPAPRATNATTPAITSPPDAPGVAGPVVRSGADASPDEAVGDPLSISIPDIGVQSPLVGAGLLADGTVAVPPDPSIAGWFTGGPRPGERGPAVIMGHVDSRAAGPGVFYGLTELSVGAVVTVETTTGPQHFTVRSVEQFPKDQFPTELVYGAEPGATLRLITCGGSFDDSIRHYRDNIVAFLVRTDV